MTFILTLIDAEKPFLVAGYSTLAKGYVFGFPYFHKTKSIDGVSQVCPCIIIPAADDGNFFDEDSEYDFALKRGEFHPIYGRLYKFEKEEGGRYLFEDGISLPIE